VKSIARRRVKLPDPTMKQQTRFDQFIAGKAPNPTASRFRDQYRKADFLIPLKILSVNCVTTNSRS
jgi:hypothetical protein